jgi:NAD(P)-dependent dehydrogenase (short-subunit alcohol dehydrogenase family)
MTLKNVKYTIAAAYMLGIGGVALVTGVTSGAGLVTFAALALLPAGALIVLWNDPQPSMSETIHGQTGSR